MKHLPNILTVLRILLIGPILWLLVEGKVSMALWLVVFAFITDFLDGRIARKVGATSELGSILDPIADKLIVVSLMIYFASAKLLFVWYVWLVVVRDIGQLLAIPILIGLKDIKFKVKPRLMPKIATAMKFLILTVVFVIVAVQGDFVEYLRENVLEVLIITSAVMEVFIFASYTKRFREIYRGQHDTFE